MPEMTPVTVVPWCGVFAQQAKGAGIGAFKSGDQIKQGALATPAGTCERNGITLGEQQVESVEDLVTDSSIDKLFADPLQLHYLFCHKAPIAKANSIMGQNYESIVSEHAESYTILIWIR
ncbi:conserved protein of unknown function [Shewanella benthica]|uniref:Uncharacterized protein n=1 Tax=Shewanella benthica TaxID=43661 RepID=A0A330M721_9GAMM|nr:conserved protein of unknown function [Shewanella benthica]